MSAIQYNEDYNYAYQSTDSLNQTFSETGRRKGATLPALPTIPKSFNTDINQTVQDFDQLEPNVSQDLSMYDDTYDCYGDQYGAQDDFSLADSFQPPPSRKSKRLPTPIVKSKVGGHRLPKIPQSARPSNFIQRKKLPSITKASVSSTQFYGDQAPYSRYDDTYSDSNYYQSTTSASATIPTSDFSTKYVSPYSSYITSSTTTTTTTSSTYFNNQAIATTVIGSNSYSFSDHSYTNSFATKLSNNLQPKSVLSSILPLTTSSSSQMHNHTGYGYGVPSVQTVTTAQTTTQSSGLGINTITKTLSSIFQSKQPTTQPKTQEQPTSLKFQLPNFSSMKSTTNTTTTTSSSIHNNDYDNNYCDDAYYSNISTLTTTTTPVTSTNVDGTNHGGSTIASNIYNNINQLSQNNDYGYDEEQMTTTMVDYSKDDYKYNYDDFSYSENDYIATGDIVQNNYNNNYDDYADDGGQMIDDINHLHQQTNDNVTNNKNFYCDSSSNSFLINQDKTGGVHHLNQEHVAKNQLGQTSTGTTSAASISEYLIFCAIKVSFIYKTFYWNSFCQK